MRNRNNAIAIVCLAYAGLLSAMTVAVSNSATQVADQQVAVAPAEPVPAPAATAKERTTVSRKSRPTKMVELLKGKDSITDQQLFKLLTEVGFTGRGHKIAFALVMRESRGNVLSHNTNSSTGDNSYGLFQINMIKHLGPDRRAKFGISTNDELFDPVTNAQAAFYMSKGENFGSWGLGADAYRSGRGEDTISEWYDDYERVKAKIMKENQ